MLKLDVEKIESLMHEKGLGQRGLASGAGWSLGHLNRVIAGTRRGEHRSINLSKLGGLCRVLDCRVEEILIQIKMPQSGDAQSSL